MSDLALLHAENLSVPHAFSTRSGGVSGGAFAGLNLDDRQDDPALVAENRTRLAAALGFAAGDFARLEQVHGTDVIRVDRPGVWTGDALVTAQAGVLLAIGTADCYPLLLADPQAGIVGAAHAGWKGTLGDIAGRTVQAMLALGAKKTRLQAAIGPGICGQRYAVGPEVAQKFEQAGLGPFIQRVSHEVSGQVSGEGNGEGSGQPHADLARANEFLLRRAGVQDIWVSGRCSTEADFYSYRRDEGQTGRMWAVIGRRVDA